MAKIEIENIENAIFNYSRYFDYPEEVVKDKILSTADKIALLKNWKQDIELQEIAEEENMQAPIADDILDEIQKALGQLQELGSSDPSPPTKFGKI